MRENLKAVPASNRKPADELADIRERIRELKTREDTLRVRLINGACSLTGDDYKVTVAKVKGEKLDTTKLKKELGLKFLRPFLRETETTFVRLKKLDGSDEGGDDAEI